MVSPLIESFVQDARYALRNFVRRPLFAIAVVATLAIGIGATTAVFSVVDRILFRPLPYADPQRLVSFGYIAPIEPSEFYLGADYMDLRHLDRTPFEAVTSWSGIESCDLTDTNPARLSCGRVESTFLPTFGVGTALGRNFTREEDQPNAPKTVLLSYGLWRSRFGGDPSVLGRTIPIDGDQARIIGVLPKTFELPTLAQADVLMPRQLDESRQKHPNTGAVLRVFARLKPGVTPTQAREQLEPLFQNSLQFVPPAFRHEVKLSVRALRERLMGDSRTAAWTLFFAVVAVLLIACANVTNLLLARLSGQQTEMAVRAALGASRARLARQALTESLVLALVGAASGCVVAYVLLRVVIRMAPQGIPRVEEAAIDGRVLAFTLVMSVICAVLVGLMPALQRPSAKALTSTRATSAGRLTFRIVLTALQVAASVVLVSTAVLLLRSLWNLQAVPLGIRTDHVITAEVQLGNRYQQPAQQGAFFQQLESRLRQVSGVEDMALSDSVPPAGRTGSRPYSTLEVFGKPKYTEGTGGMVVWRSVTPDYFRALSVPIISGRPFNEADRQPTEHPLIVSQSLAKRLFGSENAVGQRVHMQFIDVPAFTVVGVAADVKNGGIATGADPEYYMVRHFNQPFPHSTAIVRTSLDPRTMTSWMRAAVAELDPTLPVDIHTMDERVSKLQQRPRFDAVLLASFAAIALILAAVGIYAVLAFLVSQRTREIGVRMALGAQRWDILSLIAGRGMAAILVSAAAGLIAAAFAARLLRSMLFEVAPIDPVSMVAAAVAVVGIAAIAMLVPARRAAKVDPIVALRYE